MAPSLISQIMEPGGGVMLLPFVRFVITCLLILCIGSAIAGVARIHFVILSVLSGGLLLSLSFFEKEFQKVRGSSRSSSNNSAPNTSKVADKTD